MWYTTQELAEKLGCTPRTVRNRAKCGEWSTKLEPNPKGQAKLLIFLPDDSSEEIPSAEISEEKSSGETSGETSSAEIGEESSEEIQGDDTLEARNTDSSTKAVVPVTVVVPARSSREIAIPECQVALPVTHEAVTQDDAHSFSTKYHDRARWKGDLCEKIEVLLSQKKSKMQIWKDITSMYNDGFLAPQVLQAEGKKKQSALRGWLRTYRSSGRDYMSLMPKYQIGKGATITEFEEQVMLAALMGENADNRISVGSVITALKTLCQNVILGDALSEMEINGKLYKIESPSSEATLRRWADQYKEDHKAEWILKRHGMKALKDKFLPSILRDTSRIHPGDVWISDGHTLNFMVIDPDSGKPRRLTLIVFFDWGSRMPVGATVDWTENTQSIADAFRNAVLYTGYLPKLVYVDNGKAYPSKYFNNISRERYDAEVTGIFARLGVEVSFATAYNARAKIVERFFRTLDNQFERWMSGYIGASIADKPARLRRNEKFNQKHASNKVLNVEETIFLIEAWATKQYGMTVHRGIKARPIEVLKSAQIDASRHITEERLNHCMLVSDERVMNNEGIQLHNILYRDDAMQDYVGCKLTIRYSIRDRRYVKVYNKRGDYVATAKARDYVSAAVRLSPSENQLKDKKKLDKAIREQKRRQKQVIEATEAIAKQAGATPELIDTQEIKQLMQNPDMIAAPPEIEESNNVTDITELIHKIQVSDSDIVKSEENEIERLIKTMGVK